MLELIQGRGGVTSQSVTPLGRLRNLLLGQTLVGLFRSLPIDAQKLLVSTLSPRMRKWDGTRFLQVSGEPEGFIRINRLGREARGVVKPGAEYRDLIRLVREGLMSFRDKETGLPIVEEVHVMDDFVPPSQPERDHLPDLVVSWTDRLSAQDSQGLRSPTYGEFALKKGAVYRSGRSGEHRTRGWFIAGGSGVGSGVVEAAYDTIDLAPTVHQALGLSVPARFDGKPIRELISGRDTTRDSRRSEVLTT